MNRKLLLIAYYFPPECSSGVHRMINLAKYLPRYGWMPTILTSDPADYPPGTALDEGLLRRVPATIRVHRARHVRLPDFRGRLGLAYNKLGWLPGALRRGWNIWRSEGFDVILATGGPWVSLVLGWLLSKLSGSPLILDYRDPWIHNPTRRSKSGLRRVFESAIEQRIVRSAIGVVLNTPELRDVFVRAFPDIPSTRVITLTNAYDPEVTNLRHSVGGRQERALVVTHMGHLYRSRSPMPLLETVKQMLDDGELGCDDLRVQFIGSADFDLDAVVRSMGLEGIVQARPPVDHARALLLLAASDVLLLLQSGFPLQVPAKLFEYLALDKPVLALTDEGATRNLMMQRRLGTVCPYADRAALRDAILRLVREHREGTLRPSAADLTEFSADTLAKRLADFCHASNVCAA